MSTGVTVSSNLDAFSARLKSDLQGGAIAKAVLGAGEVFAGEIRKAIAGWGESSMSRPTGRLARSFVSTIVKQDDDAITLGVYSPMAYANIHETGGTIHAKNAKYLAIPLTPAARRTSPRDFPGGLIPIFSHGRVSVLASRTLQRKGKRLGKKQGGHIVFSVTEKIQPQYALVSSVTLPARHYLTIAQAAGMPKAQEFIAQALQRKLKDL